MAAKKSKLIDKIILSTDSQKYADLASTYNLEVPFLRPSEISRDDSVDNDFMLHTLKWLSKNEAYYPDYIVHLRPTTPLRDPKIIDEAINKISVETDATALRSVYEMSETAYKTFEIEDGYLKCVFTGDPDIEKANQPRQNFNNTFVPNGYVDIIKSKYLLDTGKMHGNNVIAHLTPNVGEIDNLDDFIKIDYSIQNNSKIFDKLFKLE